MSEPTIPDLTDVVRPHLETIQSFFGDRINAGSSTIHPVYIATSTEFVVDNCCPGMGWIRVVNMFPSLNFPQQDSAASNCPSNLFAVALEMGISRCSTQANKDGSTSIEGLHNDSIQQGLDLAALAQTVHCDLPTYFKSLSPKQRIVSGNFVPLDASGGCFGVATEITFSVAGCCDELG